MYCNEISAATACAGCKAWATDVCSAAKATSALPYLGLLELLFICLPAVFSFMVLMRVDRRDSDASTRLLLARSVVCRELPRLEAKRGLQVELPAFRLLLRDLLLYGGRRDAAAAAACCGLLGLDAGALAAEGREHDEEEGRGDGAGFRGGGQEESRLHTIAGASGLDGPAPLLAPPATPAPAWDPRLQGPEAQAWRPRQPARLSTDEQGHARGPDRPNEEPVVVASLTSSDYDDELPADLAQQLAATTAAASTDGAKSGGGRKKEKRKGAAGAGVQPSQTSFASVREVLQKVMATGPARIEAEGGKARSPKKRRDKAAAGGGGGGGGGGGRRNKVAPGDGAAAEQEQQQLHPGAADNVAAWLGTALDEPEPGSAGEKKAKKGGKKGKKAKKGAKSDAERD
ncbi:hypothetical protein TSOC_007563, partial [Tetrabaena socialis]